jgi:ABC-type nitrate/sulfonate/bicarbonate transport system substrate-binding protein
MEVKEMSAKKRMICGWKFVIAFTVMFALLFSGSASAAGREKVKIIYTSYLDFLMDLPIAIEKGYFDALGLDVETVDIASGPTRNSLLPQDDMNGAFLPSETALTLIDKGLDMVMVSGIGNRTFDFAVLAKSPVKSLKDFEGKTIATVPKPSNPRLALEYDLDQNHIKATLITTTTDADRLSMLLSGRVDIIFSSPPTEARLGDDIRVVHTATTSKYLWNSCGWWFKPDFIKKHPEAVTKFVQGLAKARQIIVENPAEAVRVYSKYNKLKDDSYKKSFVLPQFDNPPVIYTYGLEKTYRIMKDYKMLKKEIDTSKLVDGRFARSLTAPY